ncbi:MAG: hypothetical protein ACXAEX_01925 [Promethearchaeota archaeon]|jgi:hypothetical protein
MPDTGLNIFKLNFDGSFDEIAYDDIKDVFTIINILAIYLSKKKVMYIWIGRNATQSLKNHISNIRIIIKEEFPDFRILRNFTFEMREESYEFFNNLSITKEELYKQIDYQEQIMLPTLRKIDLLKKKLEKSNEIEDYSNAINLSKEIIELAEKIEDEALVTEQKELLTDLTARSEKAKIISEIEEKTLEMEIEFTTLLDAKEFLEAHRLVENLIERYKNIYDLTQIPSVNNLISEEKVIWDKEQKRLKKELAKLENDLYRALKNLEVEKAKNILEMAKNLFPNLLDDEIKNKWDRFDSELQSAKQKAVLIKKAEEFVFNSKSLIENYQFQSLYDELEILLGKVQELKIGPTEEKLKSLQKEIISAEANFNSKVAELEVLEQSITSKQESDLLMEILEPCEKLISIAKSIKKSDLIHKYTEIFKKTKKKLEEIKNFEENQNKLKTELKQLDYLYKTAMREMNLTEVDIVIEKSKLFLVDLVDNKIKENWIEYEKSFIAAKDLINSVDTLIKKGIRALERRSYNETLNFYEQIISLIQENNILEISER